MTNRTNHYLVAVNGAVQSNHNHWDPANINPFWAAVNHAAHIQGTNPTGHKLAQDGGWVVVPRPVKVEDMTGTSGPYASGRVVVAFATVR